MLFQRLRKSMATRAIRHEIEVARARGVRGRFHGRTAGIGDWARRQRRNGVGVVRCRAINIRTADGAPERRLAADNAVDDRRVGLQAHLLVEAVVEDAGDARTFIGAARFLLHDGGERHEFARVAQGQILGAAIPDFVENAALFARHARNERFTGGAAIDAVGVRQNEPSAGTLAISPVRSSFCIRRSTICSLVSPSGMVIACWIERPEVMISTTSLMEADCRKRYSPLFARRLAPSEPNFELTSRQSSTAQSRLGRATTPSRESVSTISSVVEPRSMITTLSVGSGQARRIHGWRWLRRQRPR